MARPKKFYEARDPFSMYIPHTLNDVIDEKCHRERKSKGQFFIDLAIHDVGVQMNTAIGVTYDHTKYVQQQLPEQQPTQEDYRKRIMNNFESVFQDLLTITSPDEMDLETFKKFKDSLDRRIYRTRNPKYGKNKRYPEQPEPHKMETSVHQYGDDTDGEELIQDDGEEIIAE